MPVREFSTKLSTDLGDDFGNCARCATVDERVTFARLEICRVEYPLTIIGRTASQSPPRRAFPFPLISIPRWPLTSCGSPKRCAGSSRRIGRTRFCSSPPSVARVSFGLRYLPSRNLKPGFTNSLAPFVPGTPSGSLAS
jgi:hypothetical protein